MMSFSVDVRDDIGAGFQPQICLFLFRQQHRHCTYLGGYLAAGADSHIGVLARVHTTTIAPK